MAWVRIDDEFGEHPKVVAAGPLAVAIQIKAKCYASRNLTNGFIPSDVVSSFLSGFEALRIGRKPALDVDWPAYMIDKGLWELAPGGYNIHDYLDYNPSKAEVLERRAKRQASGQAGGRASAQARAQGLATNVGQALASHTFQAKPNPRTPSPSEENPSVVSPQANAQANPTQLAYHQSRRHVVEETTRGNGQRIWRCWGSEGKSRGICAEGVLEEGATVA